MSLMLIVVNMNRKLEVRTKSILIAVCAVTLFVFETNYAYAEANCSSVLSFTVEREDKSLNEVFFVELRAQGTDEVTTKARLESEILKTKGRAIERCKSQYENFASCLQTKLISSGSVLQTASFSARKTLEEALASDCRKQQGNCKDAKSSEVKCVLIEPTLAPDAKGAAEGGKKGEKEKTKK